MQKFYRASLNFKLQKTAKKPAFGINVINALSLLNAREGAVNTNFLDLPVPLKELQAINNDLNAAISLAGASNSQLDLKVAILQWDAAFTLTANYITTIAKGSEIFISNAGFIPTRKEIITTPKLTTYHKSKPAVNGFAYCIS